MPSTSLTTSHDYVLLIRSTNPSTETDFEMTTTYSVYKRPTAPDRNTAITFYTKIMAQGLGAWLSDPVHQNRILSKNLQKGYSQATIIGMAMSSLVTEAGYLKGRMVVPDETSP